MSKTTALIVILLFIFGLFICSQLAKADDLQSFRNLALKYQNHPKVFQRYPNFVAISFYKMDAKKGDYAIAVAIMSYKKIPLAFYEMIKGKMTLVWDSRRKVGVNEAKKNGVK